MLQSQLALVGASALGIYQNPHHRQYRIVNNQNGTAVLREYTHDDTAEARGEGTSQVNESFSGQTGEGYGTDTDTLQNQELGANGGAKEGMDQSAAQRTEQRSEGGRRINRQSVQSDTAQSWASSGSLAELRIEGNRVMTGAGVRVRVRVRVSVQGSISLEPWTALSNKQTVPIIVGV